MNKSEIAETKLPCGCVCDQNDPKGPIFWNPFNKCVQCHKCGQSYFVERAIAESQAPQPDEPGFDEATETRWQNAIYEICKKAVGPENDHLIDGGGSDSGDALDFTLSEIRQTFTFLEEKVPELGDGEPSPEPDSKASKLSAELKAARTAWHMSYGVPVSAEHARFMEAIGNATDYMDALTAEDRCGNCDHHSDLHNDEGCTIRVQIYDGTPVDCPCGWNKSQASSRSGAAQEVSPPSPEPPRLKLQFPSKECAQGRHSECTETSDTCNCTCRGGHTTPHRYAEMLAEGDTRELKAALAELSGPTSWFDADLYQCRFCEANNTTGLIKHREDCIIFRSEKLLG